jgi:hypothetical protein
MALSALRRGSVKHRHQPRPAPPREYPQLATRRPGAAETLAAVREQAAEMLRGSPSTRVRVLVAARVCLLVCARIDALLADPASRGGGAVADTAIYRGCTARPGPAGMAGVDAQLRECAAIADEVEAFVRSVGMLDSYSALVADLVNAPIFALDDDLILHRCMLTWHTVAETYMRALQGRVVPEPGQDGYEASCYAKGDVKSAIVRTARGPVLGHHQVLTQMTIICSDPKMDPYTAFVSYKENLCWFNDWATANRTDGDIMAAIDTVMTAKDASHRKDERPGALKWRSRNAAGERFTVWLASMDHATKDVSNGSLLHTGILCGVSETARKLTVTCVCYGSYHFWPVPTQMSLDDYAVYVCACVGEMQRGWAIDHDSEAAISEHNLLNWVCPACSARASRDSLSTASAAAARQPQEMRIAWGPHSYFYYGLRHQGFRRRVDNLRARLAPGAQIPISARISAEYSPIASGDPLPVIVGKLLALCGAEPSGDGAWFEDLDMAAWTCKPRICPECSFTGQDAQLFMIAVGCARLAARLPDAYRNEFIRLMDAYGFRLFPAVQARMLVLCDCVAQWMADVMSSGYDDAGTTCGQSPCRLTASDAPPPGQDITSTDENDRYSGQLLRDLLLAQAQTEAEQYAKTTGRTAWLDIVSHPLRI